MDLKKLKRDELMDIIYELQKRDEQNEVLITKMKAKLEERDIKLKEAGNIAEASLKLNGVFEAAQASAEQYLASLKASNADLEKKIADAEGQRNSIIQNANEKAAQIIMAAEERAKALVDKANLETEEKWAAFQKNASELIKARTELVSMLGESKGKSGSQTPAE